MQQAIRVPPVHHLYLVRHGRCDVEKGRLVGSTDQAVHPAHLEELRHLVTKLPLVDGHCYCSPMRRTRQTLAWLREAGNFTLACTWEEALREIDFGRWEMQTFAEISHQDPEMVAAWKGWSDFVFPGGEAVANFIGRLGHLLERLQESPWQNLVLITHGGVIRTLICLALGLAPCHYLLFDIRPASLTRIDLFSQGGVLRGLDC